MGRRGWHGGRPVDDELAAHDAVLAELDKASRGRTIWRLIDGPTAVPAPAPLAA